MTSRTDGYRPEPTTRPRTLYFVLAFVAIYVVWGSTYLAIRYAVETIPPLIVAGVRHVIAGSVLLAWAWSRGYRPSWREWRASLVLGILYFAIGHGSLHWAETVVPSGLAALLIASEPIWIALIAALISHGERLSGRTLGGLALGLLGVGLLMRDEGGPGHHALLVGSIAILVGTLSWSIGVFFSRTKHLPSNVAARAGMPEIMGAGLLFVVAALTGEVSQLHVSAISSRSAWSLIYLITFGSIVAFTAYTWLLDHTSPTLVSTHTYVNPVIAVLLGWLWANEVIDLRVVLAGILTLLAVFLISRGTDARAHREVPAEEGELP